MTPEGRVKKAIRKVLDRYVDIYSYMPVPSGYGERTLDYLLCVAGHFVAIEAKAPGKHPTKLQELCMADISAAGGTTFVIDSVDGTYELEKFLNECACEHQA